MKLVLMTFAVNKEKIDITIPGCELIPVRTGIGKAKATMRLMDAIYAHRPDVVLNIGSAGSLNRSIGDILVCRSFIDRDFERMQIPGLDYEQNTSELLTENRVAMNWQSHTPNSTSSFLESICNTGDDFVTESSQFTGAIGRAHV